MLSMHDKRAMIERVLRLGGDGYLLKNAHFDEVVKALQTVHNGQSYFASEVTEIIMRSFQSNKVIGEIKLTPREKEVLQLICQEMTTQEIADRLYLSSHTVESHRKNLLGKTGCKNSVGLLRFAIDNGLGALKPLLVRLCCPCLFI